TLSLHDALPILDLVINQYLNRIEGRKAVVLFTDGVDTSSKRATFQTNVRDAEELDALIYPVQFDTFAEMNGGISWPRQNRRHPNGRNDPDDDVLGNVVDILGNIMNGRNGGGN